MEQEEGEKMFLDSIITGEHDKQFKEMPPLQQMNGSYGSQASVNSLRKERLCVQRAYQEVQREEDDFEERFYRTQVAWQTADFDEDQAEEDDYDIERYQ